MVIHLNLHQLFNLQMMIYQHQENQSLIMYVQMDLYQVILINVNVLILKILMNSLISLPLSSFYLILLSLTFYIYINYQHISLILYNLYINYQLYFWLHLYVLMLIYNDLYHIIHLLNHHKMDEYHLIQENHLLFLKIYHVMYFM